MNKTKDEKKKRVKKCEKIKLSVSNICQVPTSLSLAPKRKTSFYKFQAGFAIERTKQKVVEPNESMVESLNPFKKVN
jgi:hypothetical protein